MCNVNAVPARFPSWVEYRTCYRYYSECGLHLPEENPTEMAAQVAAAENSVLV
jgi:hypothetical protein